MVFSDVTTKTGILQDCEVNVFAGDYGAITDNPNRLLRFTASCNRALESITTLIRKAEGRWQWDDANNTDFPFATAALVASQQDYALDATSHFRIERCEIKDTAGSWTKLVPFDQADIYDEALSTFLSGTGLPQYYDKVGNSLFLYPKPSYSQAASLKLYFERGPSYFLTTDTTKSPGFNPLFHRLVSLKASLDYAMQAELSVAGGVMRGGFKTGLLAAVSDMENELEEYYALRDKDEHLRLKARRVNYR